MAKNGKNDKAIKKALKLSREFHGLEPRRIKNIEVEIPKALVQIGSCSQINYISDKFDEKIREYFHEFESEVLLFADVEAQPDGSWLLLLKGNFKVKPEGITG